MTELRLVRVQFSDHDPIMHGHGEEGGDCCEMKGTLRFWFTGEECRLDII